MPTTILRLAIVQMQNKQKNYFITLSKKDLIFCGGSIHSDGSYYV